MENYELGIQMNQLMECIEDYANKKLEKKYRQRSIEKYFKKNVKKVKRS